MRLLLLSLFLYFGCALCTHRPPTLTLPWGTWQATHYDKPGDVWVFENIRFGKAPLGVLRFNKSSFPEPISNPQTLQNSSYGPSCPQVDIEKPCTPKVDVFSTPEACIPRPKGDISEDCLFLDLYVPDSVFSRNISNLPVIVWLHGGAYVLGSKDTFSTPDIPLYNFTGLARTAKQTNLSAIFVVGNYRLGTLGWLSGAYMEGLAAKNVAFPNAGFYDQKLLLSWVSKYIRRVGGDPDQLSLWGESAGAGSIVHHLVAKNGTEDPGFRKAVIQSPAFAWQWDREGTLNEIYRNFSIVAGCGDTFDIDCLRSLPTNKIQEANQNYYQYSGRCTGLFLLGPSLDCILFNDLPPVAFQKGHYWKKLDSLIVSHVGNETGGFVPEYIRSNNASDFTHFIESMIPEKSLQSVRDAVETQYALSKYPDQRLRAMDVIRDSTFTCNTRQLFNAYANVTKKAVYMMQYNLLGWWNLDVHASDLLPLFWNSDVNMTFWLQTCANLGAWEDGLIQYAVANISAAYQERLLRHATSGNPNGPQTPWWSTWTQAYARPWFNPNGVLRNVMEVGGNDVLSGIGFSSWTVDNINSKAACDFWDQIALNITGLSNKRREDYRLHSENSQRPLNLDNAVTNSGFE